KKGSPDMSQEMENGMNEFYLKTVESITKRMKQVCRNDARIVSYENELREKLTLQNDEQTQKELDSFLELKEMYNEIKEASQATEGTSAFHRRWKGKAEIFAKRKLTTKAPTREVITVI